MMLLGKIRIQGRWKWLKSCVAGSRNPPRPKRAHTLDLSGSLERALALLGGFWIEGSSVSATPYYSNSYAALHTMLVIHCIWSVNVNPPRWAQDSDFGNPVRSGLVWPPLHRSPKTKAAQSRGGPLTRLLSDPDPALTDSIRRRFIGRSVPAYNVLGRLRILYT